MNEYHFNADFTEENHVLGDGSFQFLVYHGVTAVFYYDDTSVVFLNVGHSLHQNFRYFRIAEFHFRSPCEAGED